MSVNDPVNNYFAGGNRRAKDLAHSVPRTRRSSEPSTSRARIAASRAKIIRNKPLGPTPERLLKGDIDAITVGGFQRAIAPVERLRDQDKLDHMPHVNQAMFEAAEKLKRHYDGCLIGVKAQDLNRMVGTSTSSELSGEEAWVHHFDTFQKACKLMGWSDANPRRGAGRLVVAVVCVEETVGDAAIIHVGPGRLEGVKAVGMDRLREGLYALARHWRFC